MAQAVRATVRAVKGSSRKFIPRKAAVVMVGELNNYCIMLWLVSKMFSVFL